MNVEATDGRGSNTISHFKWFSYFDDYVNYFLVQILLTSWL